MPNTKIYIVSEYSASCSCHCSGKAVNKSRSVLGIPEKYDSHNASPPKVSAKVNVNEVFVPPYLVIDKNNIKPIRVTFNRSEPNSYTMLYNQLVKVTDFNCNSFLGVLDQFSGNFQDDTVSFLFIPVSQLVAEYYNVPF
jgi:hypothetical protein